MPCSISLKGQYHAIFSNTLKIEKTVDSSQDIMAKFHLKTIRMQRKYPRTFSPADDQDKEGFKFENVWPTFSNFALVTH